MNGLPVEQRLRRARFFLSKHRGIAPIPILVHIVRGLIKAELGDFRSLLAALKREPTIAGRIIGHVSRSPIYPTSTPVISIEKAINLLGSAQTKRMILPMAVEKAFDCSQCETFSLKRYMTDAIYVGYNASSIVGSGTLSEDLPSILKISTDWYSIGLLHNIGLIFMAHHDSKVMEKMFLAPSLINALQAMFGFDHYDISAVLLEKWGLPAPFHVSLPYIRNTAYRGQYWQVPAILGFARLMIPPPNLEEIANLGEQWGIVLAPATEDDMDEALDLINMVL